MWHRCSSIGILVALTTVTLATEARAQTLGTFKWQLQSYCNVLSLIVTQSGGVFTLDGFDDQCGAATRAPVTGLATPNPDGTVEFGLAIVATPGATPVHVAAAISLATLSGTWSDSAGATGNFVFTPGNGIGGIPRPASSGIPSAIALLGDGGLLASGVTGVGSIPASGSSTRMMWYPGKAAFRAGFVGLDHWNDQKVGIGSVAMGVNTTASGEKSVAIGDGTRASGLGSMALGLFTLASGDASVALGQGTEASGRASVAIGMAATASGQASVALGQGTEAIGGSSVALGLSTTATGAHAFAMGDNVVASGGNSIAMGALSSATAFESVAMGLRVTAGGVGSVVLGSDAIADPAASGTMIFADRSTTTDLFSGTPNELLMRVAGGVRIFTNAGMSAGVTVPGGGGSWSSLSDTNMKENFREFDGDDVLSKIARMPIREWNYRSQDASIRHVGPTAQDFHAAFGLGEDPLRISTIDADGIAFRAIQALEARTRELMEENAELKARLELLEGTRHP